MSEYSVRSAVGQTTDWSGPAVAVAVAAGRDHVVVEGDAVGVGVLLCVGRGSVTCYIYA